jgi:fido (protein-threonine AMPylation protein)
MPTDFSEQPTEVALKAWRFGGPQSERLCASILHSEGFGRVEPQCPLGGPDGLKDILFELNNWRYVAACYFPASQKTFKAVKKKFEDDLKGVAKNNAKGIVFFTNQEISPTNRDALESSAKSASSSVRIYHAEALRAILDSPRGYGMRLEFLRIPMKPEEQLSFISQFGSELSAALHRNSDALAAIAQKLSEVHTAVVGGSSAVNIHVPSPLAATMATRAMLSNLVLSSDKTDIKAKTSFVTPHLNSDLLCYLHRSMMDDQPVDRQAGHFRSVGVWIGAPGSMPVHARFVPPKPEDVPKLIETLLQSWTSGYEGALGANQVGKIRHIVRFHHEFLRIHPFLDGNGRLARLIMEQQARELLNIERPVVLRDSAAYFDALQKAHSGDFQPLEEIVTQALFGTWKPEG